MKLLFSKQQLQGRNDALLFLPMACSKPCFKPKVGLTIFFTQIHLFVDMFNVYIFLIYKMI